MSSGWSWFVIIGTLASLIGAAVFLLTNRTTSGEETTGHEWDGIRELDNPLPMWWVGMFLLSIVFALGYLVYYPGLGNVSGTADWTSLDQWQSEVDRHDARFAPIYTELAAMTPAQLAEDRVAQQVGRRLYLNNCATCHGVAAQGALGFPNLADEQWIWGEGFDNVKQAVLGGRNAIMPPWGAALGDSGVADVTQYVLLLAGRDHDREAASRGKAQYDMLCVACHGLDGTGNALLGSPSLTSDIWLYGGNPDQISFSIRNGRYGNMPGFAEVLGEEKAHILAGYVVTLSR
ncbi:MAG TPA: cytochrome-c oxidase, cbb3-type subunit III [Pseudomonadales bacterium]